MSKINCNKIGQVAWHELAMLDYEEQQTSNEEQPQLIDQPYEPLSKLYRRKVHKENLSGDGKKEGIRKVIFPA
jgi:hypothetical protein